MDQERGKQSWFGGQKALKWSSGICEVELYLGKVKWKHFIHVRRQLFKDGSEDNLIAKSEKCFSLDFSNYGKTECGSKEK